MIDKDCARETAAWAIECLVNRRDAFGSYPSPGKVLTSKTGITEDAMAAHFSGERVLGLHTTSPTNTSQWAALDFDCHDGEVSTGAANFANALSILGYWRQIECDAFLIDSNNAGGYHVWCVFMFPIPTDVAHRFLCATIERFGLHVKSKRHPHGVELYPKQARIAEGGYGNWLRLPGKHHTRDAWSRYYDFRSEAWIEYGQRMCERLREHEGATTERVEEIAGGFVLPTSATSEQSPVDPEGWPDGDRLPLPRKTQLYLANAKAVPEGTRNDALFFHACNYVGCGYSLSETMNDLLPRALESGLTEKEAKKSIRSAFASTKEVSDLDDAEPDLRIAPPDDEEPATPQGPAHEERPVVSNYDRMATGGGVQRVALSVDEIGRRMARDLDNWPRRAGGALFSLRRWGTSRIPPEDAVFWLDRPDALFAWLHSVAGVTWQTRSGMIDRSFAPRSGVTKGELHAFLSECSEPSYRGIERLPHEPHVPGVYYLPCDLPESNGDVLAKFVDAFNPDTDEDRELLTAALLTPLWGGPTGTRPAFLLTSDHGRGAGKTATVRAITAPYGGALNVAATSKQDWQQLRSRLLDVDAMRLRCAMIDNIKGRFNAKEFEGLLTSPVIDGKRMYFGYTSRPNLLTWYLTSNTPKLSRDLAERCVIIKIGQPTWGKSFEQWVDAFIAENHAMLLADLVARLRAKPNEEITERTRWSVWANTVLSKVADPNGLLRLISSRRGPADVDSADAEEFAEAIELAIIRGGHDPHCHRVLISRDDMFRICVDSDLIQERFGKRALHSLLVELAGTGDLSPLRDIGRDHAGSGRVWEWRGVDSDDDATLRRTLAYTRPQGVRDSMGGPREDDGQGYVPF